MVMQYPPEDTDKPMDECDHRPLAFYSGAFKDNRMHWSTLEKEGFAVVETCQKAGFLLSREGGFDIYTDHHNLTYLLSGDVKITDAKKQASERIASECWRALMMRFQYRIIHIAGKDNVFVDMLRG
jgi:hypothetical protein